MCENWNLYTVGIWNSLFLCGSPRSQPVLRISCMSATYGGDAARTRILETIAWSFQALSTSSFYFILFSNRSKTENEVLEAIPRKLYETSGSLRVEKKCFPANHPRHWQIPVMRSLGTAFFETVLPTPNGSCQPTDSWWLRRGFGRNSGWSRLYQDPLLPWALPWRLVFLFTPKNLVGNILEDLIQTCHSQCSTQVFSQSNIAAITAGQFNGYMKATILSWTIICTPILDRLPTIATRPLLVEL